MKIRIAVLSVMLRPGGGAAPRRFRDSSEASPCTFNDNLCIVWHHLMLE